MPPCIIERLVRRPLIILHSDSPWPILGHGGCHVLLGRLGRSLSPTEKHRVESLDAALVCSGTQVQWATIGRIGLALVGQHGLRPCVYRSYRPESFPSTGGVVMVAMSPHTCHGEAQRGKIPFGLIRHTL